RRARCPPPAVVASGHRSRRSRRGSRRLLRRLLGGYCVARRGAEQRRGTRPRRFGGGDCGQCCSTMLRSAVTLKAFRRRASAAGTLRASFPASGFPPHEKTPWPASPPFLAPAG